MYKAFLLAAALLIPLTLPAQPFDADINFMVGSPQGHFRSSLDREAVGLNGGVTFGLPYSPVRVGLELGIMTYGSDSRLENFNPAIPEVQVEVETTYDIFTGHFLLRYEVPEGAVRPFLDGLVGFNYLFTETSIRDTDNQFDTIASDTNFDDTAFSYGLGGGVKIFLYGRPQGDLLLNLKTRYLFGGHAQYLQPGSIAVNNGTLNFDVSESNTDLLTLHVGLSYHF